VPSSPKRAAAEERAYVRKLLWEREPNLPPHWQQSNTVVVSGLPRRMESGPDTVPDRRWPRRRRPPARRSHCNSVANWTA